MTSPPRTDRDDLLRTVADIAGHIGAHERTLRGWIHTGELKASKFGTRIGRRGRRADYDDFLRHHTLTGAQIGMSVAADQANPGSGAPTLVAGGNIIEGPGPVSATTHGLQFGKLSAGSTAGNSISNFVDSRASAGCGIFVAIDAGEVFIGLTNEFPDPPNEQDVCAT